MSQGSLQDLVAAYPGDPTGVATSILNVKPGTLVIDTTNKRIYQKQSPLGDNSSFLIQETAGTATASLNGLNYSTVALAIAAARTLSPTASSPAKIKIASGTMQEGALALDTSHIHLVGEGMGISVIEMTGTSAITISAAHVHLSDLTIMRASGGNAAKVLHESVTSLATQLDDVVLTNVNVENEAGIAVGTFTGDWHTGTIKGMTCIDYYYGAISWDLTIIPHDPALSATVYGIKTAQAMAPFNGTGGSVYDANEQDIRRKAILYSPHIICTDPNGVGINGVSEDDSGDRLTSDWFYHRDVPATWTRSGTTAIVTATYSDGAEIPHGLSTGDTVTIRESSSTSAIALGTVIVTRLSADTFSFTCSNAGSLSGTATYGHGDSQDSTWSRSATTATVTTPLPHGLQSGSGITVISSSSTGTIPLSSSTVTGVPSATTFTITCGTSAASGTLTYFPNQASPAVSWFPPMLKDGYYTSAQIRQGVSANNHGAINPRPDGAGGMFRGTLRILDGEVYGARWFSWLHDSDGTGLMAVTETAAGQLIESSVSVELTACNTVIGEDASYAVDGNRPIIGPDCTVTWNNSTFQGVPDQFMRGDMALLKNCVASDLTYGQGSNLLGVYDTRPKAMRFPYWTGTDSRRGNAAYVNSGGTTTDYSLPAFTFECWFKTDNTDGNCILLEFGNSFIGLDCVNAKIYTYHNGTEIGEASGLTILDNVEHHTAIQYDGTTAAWFLDGKLKAKITSSSAYASAATGTVGNSSGGYVQSMIGDIAEVRISDVARYTSSDTVGTTVFVPRKRFLDDANTVSHWTDQPTEARVWTDTMGLHDLALRGSQSLGQYWMPRVSPFR